MNARRVLASVLAVATLPAMAALYPDQTQLDLFRHYDPTTKTQLVTATSAQRVPYPLIDGGYLGTQVDGDTSRWDMDFVLDDVRAASKFVIEYTGYHPDSFSIYYSATGFDSMTPLVENQTSQMTSHQDHWEWTLPGGAAGTPIKYLRIVQEPSSVDRYIRIGEMRLFAAANSTYDDQKDGFNFMVNPANRPNYAGKSEILFHTEDPTVAFDNNPMTGWVRAVAEPKPNWYVVPLAEAKKIWGVNLGYYDNWGNCYIDVSKADVMPDANPVTNPTDAGWTRVYTNDDAQPTQFIPLPDVTAKWVRVKFSGGNALTEMEVYAASAAVPGDANADSKVDFADYLILESSYGSAPGGATSDADFDDNGVVEFADYLVLEANFGTGAVPEPMTLTLLGVGAIALLRRR